MEKFRRSLERFEKAYTKFAQIQKDSFFAEALSKEFQIEIFSKRFEYTFEAMWKAVKEFLRLRGVECYSPRSCFEALFKEGVISEDLQEPLFEMILIRNALVHIYDEETAKEYYEKLKKGRFVKVFKKVLEALKKNV